MDNVNYEIANGVLTIKVDLSKQFGESSTGKSLVIANSGGHKALDGADGLRLNLYVSRPTEKK
jgi:hypothetical protein